MADLLQAFASAKQLEDTRDLARRLLGANYAEKVEPWRAFVRNAKAAWQCSAIEVPVRLEREGAMPENPLLLIAAVAEEAVA